MRILVFEDNLMWSSRLVQSLKALNHEPLLRTRLESDAEGALVAIVNLGSPKLEPATLILKLKELGVYVIGHAGHKEKDLLKMGKAAGCDTLATNGELTYKVEALVDRALGR